MARIWLLLLAATHAYRFGGGPRAPFGPRCARALTAPLRVDRRADGARPVAALAAAAAADGGGEAADEAAVAPAAGGLRGWLKAKMSISKQDVAKLGVTAFFAYGFVSNVNSVLLLSFTWATFRRANPLVSPLSATAVLGNPLTWLPLKKAFLAYYVGYYATVGSFLRPFRFAIAVGLAPTFDRVYTRLSETLRVPRAVAIFLVTVATNVVFTVALLLVAVNVLCAALGVAPIPL